MIPTRHSLPTTRSSLTTKVTGGGIDAYVVTGFYENNQPGEIFIHVGKQGSFVAGIMDTVAIEASMMLQHGIPAATVLAKWEHITFDQADILRTCAAAVRNHISTMGGLLDHGYTLPTPEPTPTHQEIAA